MLAVNFLAVLVAGVVSMGFGVFWYGPLFGKQWARLMGFSSDKLSEMKERGMIKVYLVSFATELVAAYALAYLIALTGSYAIPVLASLVFWLWIGFPVPTLVGDILWEGKPLTLLFINAGHRLLSIALMGLIIVYWAAWF